METFECTRHRGGLKLTVEGCGKMFRRMERLNADKNRIEKKSGRARTLTGQDSDYYGLHKPCLNCKIGKKNVRYLEPETKTCPCGEVFSRKPNQSWMHWSNSVYCPAHSAMTPYQRNKEFERLGIVVKKSEPEGGSVKVVKPATVETDKNTAPESDICQTTNPCVRILNAVPEELPEYKFCSWDECGKIFFREDDEPNIRWASRKYCALDCRYDAEKARDRERERRNRRKKKAKTENNPVPVVDPGQARAIAQEVVEGWADILGAMTSEADRGLIESLLIKIGVECQEKAAFRGAA